MRSPVATMSGNAMTLTQCVTRTTQCVRFVSAVISGGWVRTRQKTSAPGRWFPARPASRGIESVGSDAHLSTTARESTDAIRQGVQRAVVIHGERANSVDARLQDVQELAVLTHVEIERRGPGP